MNTRYGNIVITGREAIKAQNIIDNAIKEYGERMVRENKIMEIVDEICGLRSTDCRSLNKSTLARKLMDIANIPESAEIQEIPLDWNRQVVILFLMPNDTNYYDLFAGKGNDDKFHFNLSIDGILNEDTGEFDFFEKENILDINYFKGK